MMFFGRFVLSCIRRIRSVLPLCITIVLLFYYTFQNEIDQLNSYAENEYMPSINKNVKKEQVDNKSIMINDASTKVSVNGNQVTSTTPQDLSDPAVLRVKNKYFPLLISKPSKEKYVRNSELDPASWRHSLLTHKENYPVLFEMSLPTSIVQEEKDIIHLQPQSVSEGHSVEDMLTEIRHVLSKSMDDDQLITKSRNELPTSWPIKLIDVLDTLFVMDKFTLFDEAVAIISDVDFRIPPSTVVMVDIPDLTKRALGGLLSAYELSHEEILLTQAKAIADFVMRSFDTPNRIPILMYPWQTQYPNRFPYQYADSGSISNVALELTKISQLTKTNKYFSAVYGIYDTFSNSNDEFALDSMFPEYIDASGCELMTTESISKGDHVRSSKVMKTIDENYQIVYCKQEGNLKITPDNRISKQQLFVMNEKSLPVYSNLVKLLHLLHNYDILKIPDSTLKSTEVEQEPKDNESKSNQKNNDDIPGKKKELPLMKEQVSLKNSKKYFKNAIAHISELMTFIPKSPFNKNLTLISTLQTRASFSPSTNELKVEMRRHQDMYHESCSLASTLALGSKLFNVTEYMDLASELTESCFLLSNHFKGVMPAHLYFDSCTDGLCTFDGSAKINQILNGEFLASYDETSNLQSNEIIVNNRGSKKEMANHPDTHKLQRIIMFTKNKDRSFINFAEADIDQHSITWRKNPERPLWINKIDNLELMSPNTIESIFYMYRITGDAKWREMGKTLFHNTLASMETLNQRAKGIWEIKEIQNTESKENVPSKWYSQTLKYYYLLFSDFKMYSLDDYILTSGGHFMKRNKPL